MTAEILIPVAVAILLLALLLPLMLRRRPRRSRRLVSAALEAVQPAAADPAPERVRTALPQPTVAPPAVAPIAKSKPEIAAETVFLPTFEPTAEVATAARAVARSQSRSPKFVVQVAPLKSEAPSRKPSSVSSSPVVESSPQRKAAEIDAPPAFNKVVDITTAIQVRAPKKPQPRRHHLPEEIRAGLAKLHQKIDRLEDAVLDLETQLRGFDLDFTKAPRAEKEQTENSDSTSDVSENTIAA